MKVDFLKFVIYDGKQRLGTFYIPSEATKEYIEKNIPMLVRAIQLLAGKIKETGY